jgi:hypothetical protein
MRVFRELRVSALLLLLPVIVLMAGIIKVGAGQDAIDAWQGKFTMFGLPANPWLESGGIVVTFAVLSVSYLVLCAAAFVVVHRARPAWLRWSSAELLLLLSTVSFFLLMYYASVAWVHFRDVLISPAPVYPLLTVPGSLFVFVINTVLLVNSARTSARSSLFPETLSPNPHEA